MTTNPQLETIKITLKKFYSLYFTDNKFMVDELDNITSTNSSMRYKYIIKNLLNMNLSNGNGLFIDKQTGKIKDDLIYIEYKQIKTELY